MLETQCACFSVSIRQRQGSVVREYGSGPDVGNFALDHQPSQPVGEPVDHIHFPLPHPVDVDFGFAERDAPGVGIGRFVDQPGDMQQGLGGNAPAVKADTAGVFRRIDEGDGQAHIRGQKGGRVTAGAGTDDSHCVFVVSHG